MVEPLNIDAIRNYLIKVGCKIEYPILVNAFKSHLYNPDAQLQGKIRTQFKDYVNRLATVSLENNMKFINLRPEFRPTDFVDSSMIEQVTTPHVPPLAKPKIRLEQKSQMTSQQNNNHQPPTIPVTTSQQKSHPLSPQSQPQKQVQSPMIAYGSVNTEIRPHVQPPPLPPHNNIQQQQPNQNCAPKQDIPIPTTQRSPPNVQSTQNKPSHQQQSNHPALQPRFQNSNDTLRPQPLKQAIRNNMSITTRTSSESLQEQPNKLSPTSAQSNLQMRLQQHQRSDSLDTGTRSSMMPPPPPRPPPRRRQSSASLFKPSPSKQPVEKSPEIHDLAKRGLGRVKERALKLNSSASSSDLSALMPMRNNSMKENRLSRDSQLGSISSALQRNGSHLTNRSRSSHREDESDSSSLQPTDPLRRKWAVEASNRNYNGLISLLKEDPKLASHKDIIHGYTALHWAAKFGNLDIIKLIAGTYSVSANIKSSAGYTPLHVAYMFNRVEAADLLLKGYSANPNIRDHSGKRPKQYLKQQRQ